jgi:hypothetical protein
MDSVSWIKCGVRLILIQPPCLNRSLMIPLVEFNVQKVQPVDWNKDAFQNLVIPLGRKTLLQSLVEAHHKELGFDDFIKGKGQGLVINLFGPPGVGA